MFSSRNAGSANARSDHEQTFAGGLKATFERLFRLNIGHSSAARYVAFQRMAKPRCHLLVILTGESQPRVEAPPTAADAFDGVPPEQRSFSKKRADLAEHRAMSSILVPEWTKRARCKINRKVLFAPAIATSDVRFRSSGIWRCFRMNSMPTVRMDCWADYVCPFCYLQMGVLDRFIKESRVPFVLEWHAFELRPDPIALIEPDGEYITSIWLNAVYPLAAERNVKMKLPPFAPRSRLAFETAFFSRTVERFDNVHRALFKAYFEDGRDIGNVDVLLDIASECGVDRKALAASLAGRRLKTAIEDDEAVAGRLGVTGLPFVMLSSSSDGARTRPPVVVRGVAPVEHMTAALDRLLADAPSADLQSLLKKQATS
jgi:predicted DsbA family dithiol-disulfide isomerase